MKVKLQPEHSTTHPAAQMPPGSGDEGAAVVSRQWSVVSRQWSVGSSQSAVNAKRHPPPCHLTPCLPPPCLLVYLSTLPPKTIVPEITKKLHHPVPLCYS